MKILERNPVELARRLRAEGLTRFYLVGDRNSGEIRASHPLVEPLADFLRQDERDHRGHEGFFVELHPDHDILLGAAVHKTVRGQAAGGVRFWRYDSMEEYLRDGLRLAVGMTRKNALAGLWWGGGKGVISQDPELDVRDPEVRASIFQAYGRFMTSLQGCYVTAEDVGVSTTDMAEIFSGTRFTTCIPPTLGGSGNPSPPTARGVVAGMEAALEFLGLGDLAGKRVAVQGMGHVALPLIRELLKRDVGAIQASDIDQRTIDATLDAVRDERVQATLCQRGDNTILTTACDVASPCAVGAILNPETIPQIQAKVVCGAANNQLEDEPRDGAALAQRGITYVPDFLTNRMGIVNCANEQYGFVREDPFFERHLGRSWEHSIHRTTLEVLERAKQEGRPTSEVANQLADELAEQAHPVFGHRGRQIIESLVEEDWASS